MDATLPQAEMMQLMITDCNPRSLHPETYSEKRMPPQQLVSSAHKLLETAREE
jgi:hypothetical protein